ncbi:hypothetical protein SSP35_06_02310 [Streptomyces sp. NBRC 110611]|uniref:hypothetical protein n=1 Tax=Streptomyces sp. NBRC 110611 TaxID=1621259 RepID=UPI000833AA4E|nr:hypothetical protein [Streptomyces sp. NBRC 110611]GAU68143.1 hypothetical protein SSP35_06_02310 [Streptomyces sp. NBRC 110611]
MTVLRLADAGEAADLAAFLARLIHYDRAAVVRLQAGGGVLAVFGRPPSFEVLAIRTVRLAGDHTLDTTVSAGELLDGIDEPVATLTVPAGVTGPPWTGVLPPRGGWQRLPGLPAPEALVRAVAAAVAEFRARAEALPPQHRTRAERDRIGREIWSRSLGDTHLPLRAAHAAQSLGFLRPARTGALAGGRTANGTEAPSSQVPGSQARSSQTPGSQVPGTRPQQLSLLSAAGWLRLSTPYGSIAVRTGDPAGLTGLSGLTVTPV